MNCEQAENFMPDYLHGTLDDAGKEKVRTHLQGCPDCAELARLWEEMGEELSAEEQPGPRGAQNLELMLRAFREGQRSGAAGKGTAYRDRDSESGGWSLSRLVRWPAFQVGFAASCLVLGLLTGLLLSGSRSDSGQLVALRQEVHGMRQLVTLSLLQQQSASDRLRGINWAESLPQSDAEVRAALLQVLNFDASVDVRLAAVDALRRQTSSADVRRQLVKSFSRQDSPLVQIAIIDVLGETRDLESESFLRGLRSDSKLLAVVRQRAESVLRKAE